MQKTTSPSVRGCADGIGIAGSAVCAVHCVAAPGLLLAGTALPFDFLQNEGFHQTMLWAIVPASLLAFGIGFRDHRDVRVAVMGAVGLLGLVSAGALLHDVLGETGERWATLTFAAVLMTAHVRNYRLCRAHACRQEPVRSAGQAG